jgi:hypothetical protein
MATGMTDRVRTLREVLRFRALRPLPRLPALVAAGPGALRIAISGDPGPAAAPLGPAHDRSQARERLVSPMGHILYVPGCTMVYSVVDSTRQE